MAQNALDILLIEDNPGDARLIDAMLGDADALLERVDRGEEAADTVRIHEEPTLSAGLDRFEQLEIDAVLLDLGLPDSTGMETLRTMADATQTAPIIVLTGLRDEQVGIEAIQEGAQDFLVKDEVTSDLLVRSIHHAIERDAQERRRLRRRHQLEALNTLTRALMEAETQATVSELVVEAATEGFDVPVAAVALYEEGRGGLTVTEATAEARDLVAFDELLRTGEGAGWRAFAEAESPSILEADGPVSDPLSALALYPIGDHGLLVAGSTQPGGLSTADVDFLGTVAGNIESALDRVAHERERNSRERLLEEQNRTLERLNEINDIIRSIGRALVQASTREEVEAVVCEQLVADGPYDLAWIGEHDQITDAVVARETAGDENENLAGLSGADSPPSRTLTTREPLVVNDMLENRAMEEWRQRALDLGYQATMSLPLVYEDALYGSLNVYATEAGVFGDLEQTVLSELADTIAYAINGAESRKALLGQEVTALEFRLTDTDVGFVELARTLECSVVAENFVPRSDGGVRRFMTTRGAESSAVLESGSVLPAANLTLVSEYETDEEPVCLFRMDLTADSVEETVLEHGGRPRSLRAEEGEATGVVELAADAAVREFVDLFQSRFPGAELTAQRASQRPRRSPAEQRATLTESLTDRQLEALQTAYFSGFFDRPRRHTGTDVADSMGISQPTFSHHLREAHRRLCSELFGGDSEFETTDDE